MEETTNLRSRLVVALSEGAEFEETVSCQVAAWLLKIPADCFDDGQVLGVFVCGNEVEFQTSPIEIYQRALRAWRDSPDECLSNNFYLEAYNQIRGWAKGVIEGGIDLKTEEMDYYLEALFETGKFEAFGNVFEFMELIQNGGDFDIGAASQAALFLSRLWGLLPKGIKESRADQAPKLLFTK